MTTFPLIKYTDNKYLVCIILEVEYICLVKNVICSHLTVINHVWMLRIKLIKLLPMCFCVNDILFNNGK